MYGWWLMLIAIALGYLAWQIHFGSLHDWVVGFLAGHADWYVSGQMIAQWVLLLSASFFIVGYLRAYMVYSSFRFLLDEHGFNLSKGIFFVNETTIPYQQISNVRIARPYHYRMVGLSKLDITTNGDSGAPKDDGGADFLMPVIDAGIAKGLSRQLMTYATMAQHGEKITNTHASEETDEVDAVDGDMSEEG
jgi:uncharacterized membrane protein YdbT with pleckstrin-like domain